MSLFQFAVDSVDGPRKPKLLIGMAIVLAQHPRSGSKIRMRVEMGRRVIVHDFAVEDVVMADKEQEPLIDGWITLREPENQ